MKKSNMMNMNKGMNMSMSQPMDGGRFDFDDGGSYVGVWCDGRAHGLGIATGPENQGEYSGEWILGFESRGVYIWPSGNIYAGTWLKGKRHGEGVQIKGEWVYKGSFTTGFCGRYGLKESLTTPAKYEGSWHLNLFDGFGIETNSDGSTYAGGWFKGVRQGLGVRRSVPYGLAADTNDKSLRPSQSQNSIGSFGNDSDPISHNPSRRLDGVRSGFILRDRSDPVEHIQRKSIFSKRSSSIKTMITRKLRKQKSTGDLSEQRMARKGGSMRSNDSGNSHITNNSVPWIPGNSLTVPGAPPQEEIIINPDVIETYSGQWNEDKRSGFGVAERSDGLKYEGEWFNNKKDGYGVTTFKNGTKEEGRYKNNVLMTALNKRNKLLLLRHSRLRESVEEAVRKAQEAAREAVEKAADTALQRAQSARQSSFTAEQKALEAQQLSEQARVIANNLAPEFVQPGIEWQRNRGKPPQKRTPQPTHRDSSPNTAHHNQSQGESLKAEVLEVSGSRRGSFRSSFRKTHGNALTNSLTPAHNKRGSTFSVSSQQPMEDTIHAQVSGQAFADPKSKSKTGLPIGAVRNKHNSDSSNQKNADSGPQPKFSDITASTQLTDHYDQYVQSLQSFKRTKRDSGLGRDSSLDESTSGTVGALTRWDSGTPDSGMSDHSQCSRGSKTRRRTLPSIVTGPIVTAKPEEVTSFISDNIETYIIEDGVRMRVKDTTSLGKSDRISSNHAYSSTTSSRPTSLIQKSEQAELAPLPRNYEIQSSLPLSKDLGDGSLPDVSLCRSLQRQALMTREEVTKMSQARRQELLQEAERRRRGEVVIRLADMKDWIQRHIVLILVILVNGGLAILFYRLATGPS